MSKPTQKTKTSISQKMKNLDEQIEWFYGEDFDVDAAVQKYQAASQLAQEIKQDLSELKNEITVIADFTKS